jgi:hypothetical protein
VIEAPDEPVTATIDGERREITKREAVVTQLVSKSAAADLRATKMLVDMLKDDASPEAMNRGIPNTLAKQCSIGIGGTSRPRPSHTTVHTGLYTAAPRTIRTAIESNATSMTQVLVDRFQTFNVFSSRRKYGVSGEYRLHKKFPITAHDVFGICGGRSNERSRVPARAESRANARSAIAAGRYRGGAEPKLADRGFASRQRG